MTSGTRNGVLDAIGGTALVRLDSLVPPGAAEVWVKLEGTNPTGSYKDRMAVSLIEGALHREEVRSGDTVVEYTGGSTGTSLAMVCAVTGLRFTAVFSDAFSASKRQAMEAFGATVVVERSDDGLITSELADRMRRRALDLADRDRHHYADQFGSPDVPRGYASIGREVAEALDGELDAVCMAVGTGGALMGTLAGLAETGVHPRAVAVEPAEAPLLTAGRAGAHTVEGVAVFSDPPFLDRTRVREVRVIAQERAFEMCRALARTEAIFGGGSTGLNVAAAIDVAQDLGRGHRVLTVACDSGLKYVGGHIYR